MVHHDVVVNRRQPSPRLSHFVGEGPNHEVERRVVQPGSMPFESSGRSEELGTVIEVGDVDFEVFGHDVVLAVDD